jgi:hypothetical protein
MIDHRGQSARELTAATFGQELASALRQVDGWITDPDHDEDLNLKDKSKLIELGNKLKTALREVWKDPGTDIFDIGLVYNFYAEFIWINRFAARKRKHHALTGWRKRLARIPF